MRATLDAMSAHDRTVWVADSFQGFPAPEQASIEEVAEATVRCLKASVPSSLPGIVFLSGGQTDEQATAHLNAMNQIGPHPWPLSFQLFLASCLSLPVLGQ